MSIHAHKYVCICNTIFLPTLCTRPQAQRLEKELVELSAQVADGSTRISSLETRVAGLESYPVNEMQSSLHLLTRPWFLAIHCCFGAVRPIMPS